MEHLRDTLQHWPEDDLLRRGQAAVGNGKTRAHKYLKKHFLDKLRL